MKKNNKGGYAGFGFLIGIWTSISIVYYMGQDWLMAVGIIGAGVCFLGFVYFYTQNNKLKEKIPEAEGEDKSFLEKARIWKND